MYKMPLPATILLYTLIIGVGLALIWMVLPHPVPMRQGFPPSVVDVCQTEHPPVPCKGAF